MGNIELVKEKRWDGGEYNPEKAASFFANY
jgi:hypothetical protein